MTTAQDALRVAAIDDYEVLGRPSRRDLEALVELAALIAQVPMATINLITATEQHQVAVVGFAAAVCRREDSMCAISIQEGAPVVVADASLDERFRANPFVNGEIGSVRFYAAHQLRTPDGTVIGTLCVFDTAPRELDEQQRHALATVADRVVDLLELGLTTRRLEAANEQLSTSNERLAAFAGQVSHDLKNPLAAITMSLEMAVDEAEDLDPDGSSIVLPMLERAVRGADRMEAMIGDLLAFARGGGRPELQPVDLGVVAREVQEDLLATATGATIEVGELPVVQGDPVQLRALVQNLVANGIKFARPDVPARVSITAERLGDHWRAEVTDNGRGVAAEDRERVFDPFVRVDKAVPGTGIGLSTCKRIVEAHGGRIGLEAAPDGGTRAWFELPAQSL